MGFGNKMKTNSYHYLAYHLCEYSKSASAAQSAYQAISHGQEAFSVSCFSVSSTLLSKSREFLRIL